MLMLPINDDYVVGHRVIDEWAELRCLVLTSRAQRTSQTWRRRASTTCCCDKV